MFKISIKFVLFIVLSCLLILTISSGQHLNSRVVDLDKGEENIRILGENAYDYFGISAASGDINGDGYDDVIIGAPYTDSEGRYNAGETYVLFGSSSPQNSIDLHSESSDMTIYGDDANDHSGCSVSSGDINGDGYDDVIIGAFSASPAGRFGAGETYIIFGSASPLAVIDLNSVAADMTIYGDDADDYSGNAVSSGDVNGDGYDDVIICASWADTAGGSNAGETYVIFGSASPPAVIDLNSVAADMTIYGDDADDFSGDAVSSGDINGDGCDDVIIGAPYADPADPAAGDNTGETYVIFGSSSPPATIDLNSQSAGMTIYADDENDWCGYAVASGDINNDGYHDVIISSPGADLYSASRGYIGNVGETYIIFGSASSPAIVDLNSESADITIFGTKAADFPCSAVGRGNINGDGFDDIIIGAPLSDQAAGDNAGETYVIFGNSSPQATIDLNSVSADMIIYGDDADDYSSYSVSSGDINGDGYDDVIIGAYGADPGGRSLAGEVYVIFGSGLPIECDFSDANISDWEKVGYGKAKVRNGQLLLRNAHRFFRTFPPGAISNKCDIEVKVIRKRGNFSKVSSSIFFGYEDKRNFWELRMQLNPVGARIPGKWILMHKKNGSFVQKKIVKDNIYRKQQYQIKIEVRGDQIRVIVNGVEKINLTPDEKPAWGKIGLAIRGAGKGFFDDLLIY